MADHALSRTSSSLRAGCLGMLGAFAAILAQTGEAAPHRESGGAARYTSSRGSRQWGRIRSSRGRNSEWVRVLSADGETQAAALEELRAYLLRAARYALGRARGCLTRASAFDLTSSPRIARRTP